MWDAVRITGVYIAAVIGAGFASGSEAVYYFLPFGKNGIFGILFACTLFGLAAEILLRCARDTTSYTDCLSRLLPRPLVSVTERLTLFFMGILFVSMLSGGGELISELCACPKQTSVLFLCLFCGITFLLDLRGLIAVNNLLAVCIIFGMLFVCLFLLFRGTVPTFSSPPVGWAISGGIYTGYNILTAGMVLAALGKGKKLPSGLCGLLSGIAFFLMLTALWLVLRNAPPEILSAPLPMLTLCKQSGATVYRIYAAVLLSAMLTTALCNGFFLLDRIFLPRPLRTLLLTVSGYFLAGVDFSFLVNRVYRIIGILGLVFLIAVLVTPFKKFKKDRKTAKNSKIKR